jgi:two-component system, OmpR family, sensor histidine kinase KdpD
VALKETSRTPSDVSVDLLDLLRHEFRTPVSVMMGALETLRAREAELGPTEQELLMAILERQLGHLASMIERLSALRDLQGNQLILDLGPLDVTQVVEEVVADVVSVTGPSPGIVVHARGPATAIADVSALQEILMNLLNNAIEYTAGAPIDVTVAETNGVVEIRVRDHGPGLTVEDERRVFSAYVRGADQGPGLGIGLTLGRGLAEAQSGTLTYDRSPSESGAVFVLRLPRAR